LKNVNMAIWLVHDILRLYLRQKTKYKGYYINIRSDFKYRPKYPVKCKERVLAPIVNYTLLWKGQSISNANHIRPVRVLASKCGTRFLQPAGRSVDVLSNVIIIFTWRRETRMEREMQFWFSWWRADSRTFQLSTSA